MEICLAAYPAAGMRGVWEICMRPAIAVHEYSCPNGHSKIRGTCADHMPGPDSVGCLECLELGNEVSMQFAELGK